jgi:hypothetical protein
MKPASGHKKRSDEIGSADAKCDLTSEIALELLNVPYDKMQNEL